jgi:hypothetical protein
MPSQMFKFAVVRSVQTASLEKVTENNFFLSALDEGLVDALRKAKKENDKATIIKLAQAYSKSSKFIDSTKKIDAKLIEFIDSINSNKSKNYNQFVRENYQRIFTVTPSKFIDSPIYKQTFKAVSESLVATAIDSSIIPKVKSLVINLAKALQVINLIVKEKPITREQISQIKMVLPSDIFPLPLESTNLKEHRKLQAETQKKAIEERQKKSLALSEELKRYTAAADEILKIFDSSSLEDELPDTSTKKRGGFFLPPTGVKKMSAATKNVVKQIGLNDEEIDVAKTVTILEKHAAEISQKIYAGANNGGRMARIGSNDVMLFPDDILELTTSPSRIPGACPPTSITTVDNPTPISTNGLHDVRILGIADLMVVEQELGRYELGEIAHIENVLKSELRDRKHRINTLTEESVTTETEETDTKENDLSSTERFELQTESQKVINESTSMDAGATISASYGFVNATANFNYSNSDSSSDSQRSASNFARETTSKAVSKLEKRNLERRFRRTVRETEEINQHTFDNKAGTDNITGVYRFVDKIYNAQIVNYGKRFMLEFIVPEPAAFLRYAMTSQPVETSAIKPEEPGYCIGYGRKFMPLQVQDIDRTNYLFWASKYGVEDINTPPSQTVVVSTAVSGSLKEMDQIVGSADDKEFFNTKNISIDIPEGYYPLSADIRIDAPLEYNDDQDDTAHLHLLIDRKNFKKNEFTQFAFSQGVWKNVAVAINSFNKVSYAVLINIYCRPSLEKEQKWKLETFNAIINAYKDQLTRYNNAIESARIRAGFTEIRGTNPFINRETEKTELKKGCITLLTGQQFFENFDAMNRNVGINRYPEIDIDDAADEGRFISFFEQAFEWNNMTYVFYPYFWANKKEWLQLSQLKDTDPLFTKFLQAGSCRVNIPVRIGFETSMLNYLNNNIIWQGEGALINSIDGEPDPLHISVVEELKSQMNNMNIDGTGKLNVTKDSNTITGINTIFSIDDENKRIIVGGKTYVIKLVDSETTIQLKTPYKGDTQTGLTYSFGAKLVGEPWEVKLPTDLVKIDNNLIF